MPLTPEDVQSKRFTVTRFKAGYDEEEVDAFLDEVETELRRLLAENAELRDRLAAVSGGAPFEPAGAQLGGLSEPAVSAPRPESVTAPVEPADAPEPAGLGAGASLGNGPGNGTGLGSGSVEGSAVASAVGLGEGPANGPLTAPAEAATPTAAPAQQQVIPGGTAAELDQISEAGSGEEAALRTLRAAQRTADGIIAEARGEAQQILAMARERSAALEQETRERQHAVLSTLTQQRQDLEARVEGLRAFERDYRTRIRAYLEGQLREVDRAHLEPPRAGAAGSAGGGAHGAGFGAGPALTPPPSFAPSPGGGQGDSRSAGSSPWTMAPSPAMQPGLSSGRGPGGPPPLRGPRDGRIETDTGEVDEQHNGGAA